MAQQAEYEAAMAAQQEGSVQPSHIFPSSGSHCGEEYVAVSSKAYTVKKPSCHTIPQPKASAATTVCASTPMVNGFAVGNASSQTALAGQDPMGARIGSNMNVLPTTQQMGHNMEGYTPQANNPTNSEQAIENAKGINYYDPKNQKVKNVFLTSHFSLAEADADPAIASARIKSKSVFECKIAVQEINPKNPLEPIWRKVIANLKTSVITGVYLVSAKNEHAVPIAAAITGVRGNTHTAFGDNYSFVMHSNSMNTYGDKGLSIFKRRKMDETYMSIYGGLTEKTIWMGIYGVPGIPDYVFVVPEHAIISVLKMNSELIDLKRVNRSFRGMYEMKRAFVKTMIDNIIDKALRKLPYVDLNECVVSFYRADVGTESGRLHYTNPKGNLRVAEDDGPLMKLLTTTPYNIELSLMFVYFVSSAI